ncbi:hypothetical protein K469DRAFT_750940 [Zopfia rhizophila CBS 207.26]|uniref:Uncharacterized protein n=1 Tax=Zopfia rhizophila CBS 207.26 TaxID=1314779 RepID=A0A6A6DXA0_9PEZI|nr:hypothetical protein K469DRAFT_750940 [Zopfia rhizophila CBS 207.26]
MRLTRAALRAEATENRDNETADASKVPLLPTPLKERVPLGEVSTNAVAEQPEPELEVKKMAAPKKTKAKGGKKAAKGKKGKKADVEVTEGEQVEVLEDERKAAGSPASDAAVDELAKGQTDNIVQVPMNDEHPASPPSRAVRMTRRQLAKVEEQLLKSQRLPSPPSQSQPASDEIIDEAPVAELQVDEPTLEPREEEAVGTFDADQNRVQLEPAVIAPEVEVTTEDPEPKILASEKPCEEESTPAPSRTPSRSPSKSPAKTPMRLEESIEAIDALEEAIEQVGKAIPVFEPDTDEKPPRKAQFDVATSSPRAKPIQATTVRKSPLATTKVSRNPSAPKSLKPTTANAAKPAPLRPSISRSASTRAPSKNADGEVRTGSGEVTDYLASKRRPISMLFPAPPPPPRSTKPLTRPTFQLPGEAVAAKLKAQKEERLRREEEEAAKKPAFKARPAPVRKTVPSNPVRQSAASKARENMMNGKPAGSEKENKTNGAVIPPKRTDSIASKRQSTIETTARSSFTTSMSNHSASNRLSLVNPGPVTKSTVTAADAAAQRLKAREIFNRDKVEKEQREKERKGKEEAAKRARAEAAERSRIASREWAEKQRLKKMAAAPAKADAA